MPTFEYLTVILDANPLKSHVPKIPNAPMFAVAYLKPQLDALGAEGWELVSLEPVIVGDNEDVMPVAHGAGFTKYWTHQYLCTFKRSLMP